MKKLKLTAILFSVLSLLLAACTKEVINDNQPADQNEQVSVSLGNDEKEEVKIAYRFASQEEGASLLTGNTEYYNGFSQNDLDYRLQKKGATLEEMKVFAAEQVLEFSEEEKQGINRSISEIESILNENGYVLPKMDEIVFVKTTMLEEGGAEAYTHKTEIYVGDLMMERLLSDDETVKREGNATMCHEIFHCLTRNDSQFREDMYSIINFTVNDKDYEMGPEIYDSFISNPDVDHHNSYATFTINGEEKDCFMALITMKPFEEEGDFFTDYAVPALVPVDDTNTYYSINNLSVEDFFKAIWEVTGNNTDYVIDPEECLADNFGYAIVYGKAGIEGQPYKTPEIIDEILDYLEW